MIIMDKKLPTLLDELKDYLHNKGMFENQVEDVVKLVIEDESMKEMKGRWNDTQEDYGSAPMIKIIILSARPIALKYIDDNCPQAWFRPMFLSLKEQQKLMSMDGKIDITNGGF
jgi:hypothetical protein